MIKFECDAVSGRVKCYCQSAGLVSCFPGTATVSLPGGATKRMADVALGDSVLSVGHNGRLQYSPVYMFSSRRPTERAAFMRIHTDAGLSITATQGHYLFAWKGSAAAAAEAALATPAAWPYVLPTQIEVGDLVPVAVANASSSSGGTGQEQQPALVAAAATATATPGLRLARVTKVEQHTQEGVYMPHTLTGAIVVDGVVASELTSLVPPSLAGPAFQRGLAAALRLAFTALPAHLVEAAVKGVSGWMHGGVVDAAVSYQAFVAAPASM